MFALSWVLAFPAGLLIFNPINIIVMSFKRSWRNRLADVMEDNVPVSLAAKIMAVVTFALLLVAMFVILNPFIVWVMALIAPKWVAETCYGDLSEGFWSMLLGIPLSWQGWIGHLLPWRCRKHFVEERFDRYSSKDRMRLTLHEPSHFFELSDEEREKVFCCANIEQMREWMERGVEMTLPMFRALARVGAAEAIEYANRHNNRLTDEELGCVLSFGEDYAALVIAKLTLSDEQLLLLAKIPGSLGNLLAALRRQGCGKAAIPSIMEAVKTYARGNAEEAVRQALAEWRQKGQVSQLAGKPELFKLLLRSEDGLCSTAQVKMSVEQYRIYHECGWKLDKESIRWFFLYSAEMTRAIFELEENRGIISQEIKDLVFSSPELSNLLLEVQDAEAEKSAAEKK